MKSRVIAILAAGLVSAAPAFAGIVTVDFEGVTSFAPVGQYDNGGNDGASNGPGPGLGIVFGDDALAFVDDPAAPTFANEPSPATVMSPVAGTGDDTLNFLPGFGFSAVSLFYSSPAAATIRIWSGFNGSGSQVGHIDLTNNQGACATPTYCQWDLLSINSLTGIGRSITFSDTAVATAAFDDISLTAVPAPASLALLTVGLAGLGVGRRRTARPTVPEQTGA